MPPKKSAAKKKKALGAARGFATTSVPRKVTPEEEAAAAAALAEAEAAKLNGDVEGGAKENRGAGDGAENGGEGGENGEKKNGENGEKKAEEDEWDPDAVERQELQSLAERIRAGCDKEVSRIVKVSLLSCLASRQCGAHWYLLFAGYRLRTSHVQDASWLRIRLQ